jgi:hypothetical protein
MDRKTNRCRGWQVTVTPTLASLPENLFLNSNGLSRRRSPLAEAARRGGVGPAGLFLAVVAILSEKKLKRKNYLVRNGSAAVFSCA